MMRLDRDSFVDIDHNAIEDYEKAVNLRVQDQYLRCDQHGIGRKRACRKIGNFDGSSILMYPPTLTAPVYENGQTVNKQFTFFTLKKSAHELCGGQCEPGQRNGLSPTDITDIASLYKTTCSKNFIKIFSLYNNSRLID